MLSFITHVQVKESVEPDFSSRCTARKEAIGANCSKEKFEYKEKISHSEGE